MESVKIITVEGVTYDISEFNHPGGNVIDAFQGKDATDMFMAMHSPFSRAKKTLQSLPVVKKGEAFETPFGKLHDVVIKQIVNDPLYESRVQWWLFQQLSILSLLCTSWVAILPFSPILSCLFYSATVVFVSGLAHNMIHGHFGRVDAWKLELMSGFSLKWWKKKHNILHHCHTNVLEKDTDIHSGIFAFDSTQKSIPLQHLFFWPILSILRIWWGIKGLMHNPFMCCAHHVLVTSILLSCMSPISAAQWYLAGNMISGLALGFAVVQAHTAETILSVQGDDHLAHTAITTRNMPTGWPHDLASGYLNYQIEHHLFPWLPCVFFEELQVLVKQSLEENKLPYTQLSWTGSAVKIHRHLRAVSS
jgi:fatty acid desaturase